MKSNRSRSRVSWYPAWVYVAREDLTRANMDLYDRQQAAIDARCLAINPEYNRLPLRERFDVRREAEKSLGIK